MWHFCQRKTSFTTFFHIFYIIFYNSSYCSFKQIWVGGHAGIIGLSFFNKVCCIIMPEDLKGSIPFSKILLMEIEKNRKEKKYLKKQVHELQGLKKKKRKAQELRERYFNNLILTFIKWSLWKGFLIWKTMELIRYSHLVKIKKNSIKVTQCGIRLYCKAGF